MRFFLGAITVCALALVPLISGAVSDNLFLEENFEGTERYFFEGTLEERNFRYVDGEYEIDTTGSEDYGQSIILGDLKDYRAQVSARLVMTGDDNGGGYGLAFNYNEGEEHNDFMLFLVYDGGAFTVLRYSGGETQVVTPPARTGLLKPLAMNTIAVENTAGAYSCLINGEVVAQGQEESLKLGGAGIFCTARSIARYDNFQVFADPPPEPVLDDFEGQGRLSAGNWQDVQFSYDAGRFVIDTTNSAGYGLAPFPGSWRDLEFAADIELTGGNPQGGFGLYLRDSVGEDGSSNQLRFLINGNWFCVEQSAAGAETVLAEWQKHDAIRAQGVNRLKVIAQGADLVLFANGVEVWRGADPAPAAGDYGFIACEGVKVAFDNSMFLELR